MGKSLTAFRLTSIEEHFADTPQREEETFPYFLGQLQISSETTSAGSGLSKEDCLRDWWTDPESFIPGRKDESVPS